MSKIFKSLSKTGLSVGLSVAIAVLPLAACSGNNTTEIAPLGKNNICLVSSDQKLTPVPSIIELTLKGMLDQDKTTKAAAEKSKGSSVKDSPTLSGITEQQVLFLKMPAGGEKIRNLIKNKNCGLVFVTDPSLVEESKDFAYKISKRSGVVPQFVALVPDSPEKKVYPFNVLKVNLQEPAFIAGFTAAALTRSGKVATLYSKSEQEPRSQAFVKGVEYYNMFTGAGIKSYAKQVNYEQVELEYGSFTDAKVDMFFYPGVLDSKWGFSNEKNRAKLISIAPGGQAAITENKALAEQKNPGMVYDGNGSLVQLTVNPERYLAEVIKLAQEGKPITNTAQLSLANKGVDYSFDPAIEGQLPGSLKRQLEGIKRQFTEGKLNLEDLQ